MSERPEIPTPAASSGEAVRIRAAEWLVSKRTAKEWTEQDQESLNGWLRESDEHLLAYWRLEAGWERSQRLAALRVPSSERPVRGMFVRIAAALVLLCAIVGGAWIYLASPTGTVYATSVGGHETVLLTDGSKIELNTDTRIRLAANSNARNIWLEKGEAYFDVVHSPDHPFIVFAGSHRITDIGTQFAVKSGTEALEVSVLEGHVKFDTTDNADSQRALHLTRGDVLLASASGLSVTRKSEVDLSNELGWRSGVIVFTNVSLGEAAEQLNRYTPTKIVIADQRLARLPVNGTVSATNPQEFLQMTRTVFGLRAEKLNGEYVISR